MARRSHRATGGFSATRLTGTPAWIRWTWSWWPRIGLGLAAAFFTLGLGIDFAVVWLYHLPSLSWSHRVSGLIVAVGTLAVLPRRRRPVWVFSVTLAAAAVVFGLSVAAALFLDSTRGVIATSGSEVFGVALLALLTVRRCGPRRAAAAVTAAAVALGTAAPLRMYDTFTPAQESLYLVLLATAVSTGLLLRAHAVIRAQDMDDARKEERLALARDVHDTVAHHMTGIIVQSQASRHVAERDPTAAARALEQIERAGTEALTAMRRVVTALRDDAPVRREPQEFRDALEELTGPEAEPPAHLVLDNGTNAKIPAEVSATVLLVAREALTNARRHARGATRIDVAVDVHPDHVTLNVSDDGRGASQPDAAGYGLAGIAERAKLLGGEFSAGPIDGRGWRVRTLLPMNRSQR